VLGGKGRCWGPERCDEKPPAARRVMSRSPELRASHRVAFSFSRPVGVGVESRWAWMRVVSCWAGCWGKDGPNNAMSSVRPLIVLRSCSPEPRWSVSSSDTRGIMRGSGLGQAEEAEGGGGLGSQTLVSACGLRSKGQRAYLQAWPIQRQVGKCLSQTRLMEDGEEVRMKLESPERTPQRTAA
jgi:hypothetical protein